VCGGENHEAKTKRRRKGGERYGKRPAGRTSLYLLVESRQSLLPHVRWASYSGILQLPELTLMTTTTTECKRNFVSRIALPQIIYHKYAGELIHAWDPWRSKADQLANMQGPHNLKSLICDCRNSKLGV